MYGQQAEVDRLLLIHPDAGACSRLARNAEHLGFTVHDAPSAAEAVVAIRENGPFGVIVLGTTAETNDNAAPTGAAYVDMVRSLKRQAGQAEIIFITQQSLSMDTCCDLLHSGVSSFVDARDGQIDDSLFIDRITRARQQFQQITARGGQLHAVGPAENNSLVWQSPAMANLLNQAARTAQVSDIPILIYGESGTGKQLLAELIHQLDPKRSGKRFLSVNCSAITGTLAESTLFGHLKGAFTGAISSRKGNFRAACGGTILLDEIGEMDLALQPKLLRVLQEDVVMPLGSDHEVKIDVRIIAATNRRLAALVEEGKFRLDLYQRLNVITLEIPPLRERPEDIPALIQFFLKKYANYYKKPIESVDPRVYELLAGCTLQGNVRELENTVRQMLAFKSTGTTLVLEDIPTSMLTQNRNNTDKQQVVLTELANAACRLVETGAMTLPQLVRACEKMVLHNSLRKSNVTSAILARQLGLSRRTLYNKIQKYELSDPGDSMFHRQ